MAPITTRNFKIYRMESIRSSMHKERVFLLDITSPDKSPIRCYFLVSKHTIFGYFKTLCAVENF